MIRIGDCLEVMAGMDENSVDAIVTDPPYGIGFMGKAWDGKDIVGRLEKRRAQASHDPNAWTETGGHKSAAAAAGSYDLSPTAMRAFQEFSADWARAALRVLKPGGYCVAFASPRTFHRLVCGLEEAGFEIRDTLMWIFGSGFPKSKNLRGDRAGWGTALKPAWEPIVLARKPLDGTVEKNVAAHGTGALNIGSCRVPGAKPDTTRGAGGQHGRYSPVGAQGLIEDDGLGRWPANLVHDGSDEVMAAFPSAPGQQADASTDSDARETQMVYGAMRRGRGEESSANAENGGAVGFKMRPGGRRLDTGSAARFFYCAKASRADRNDGCDSLPTVVTDVLAGHRSRRMEEMRRPDGANPTTGQNHHPTVKPTDLMRWLCRLVTPPGGIVLDPFAGSGSTGRGAIAEGFQFVGIELDPEYAAIAEARIRAIQPGLALGAAA